jgi:hypothetical protein
MNGKVERKVDSSTRDTEVQISGGGHRKSAARSRAFGVSFVTEMDAFQYSAAVSSQSETLSLYLYQHSINRVNHI